MTLAEMLRIFVRPLYETQRPAHPTWESHYTARPSPPTPAKGQGLGKINTINWDQPLEKVVEQTRDIVERAWK